MKTQSSSRNRGFSLVETVIAIGVLSVLLGGFLIVFPPAAASIKKALSLQEADRLASTLEQELVTLRGDQKKTFKTGFDKAFPWIKEGGNSADNALLVYQYRGSLTERRDDDGTPIPVISANGGRPGADYIAQTMMRRKNDPKFTEDLAAVEGGVYLVKCTQLVFNGGELKAGTVGQIVDPKKPDGDLASADLYPESVIAFSAEFYALPANSPGYFQGAFVTSFANLKAPVFTRNLAARR